MYKEKSKKGKIIAIWSPVKRQGACSTNTALITSYLSNAIEDGERVLLTTITNEPIDAMLYLTNEQIRDSLSDICMLTRSQNLAQYQDVLAYTYKLDDKLDLLGINKKKDIEEEYPEISDIYEKIKNVFEYIIIDTVTGVNNQLSKNIIEIADKVIVNMPQDKYVHQEFIKRNTRYYIPQLDNKEIIYISSLHYEYKHFKKKDMTLSKNVDEISMNDTINKADFDRQIYNFVKSEIKKKKPDECIYEISKIIEKIIN